MNNTCENDASAIDIIIEICDEQFAELSERLDALFV